MLQRRCLQLLIVVSCVSAGLALGEPPAPPRYQLVLKMPPTSGVRSVAVSADGSLIVTDGGEGGVLIYDATTGALLRAIDRVGDNKVAFSPDGRSLVAAGFRTSDGSKYDPALHLRDVETGKLIRKFEGHTEIESYSVAFSPDGRLLASGGKDKEILVWEVATGVLRHRFADQAFPVSALAFSPDSRVLASGGGEKLIRLWDMESGSQLRALAGHRDWVSSIAFSHDGRRIASAGCDWGFHRGHDWPLPEGRGPEQSEWKLWDTATGDSIRTVAEPGRMLAVAFTADDKALVCAIGKDVRLYDLTRDAAARFLTRHDGLVTSVALSPDGASVFTSSHDHTVKSVRLADGALERRLSGYREQVSSVALSSDSSLLAAASGDSLFARGSVKSGSEELSPGAIRLWDAHSGRLLQRLGDPSGQFLATALSADGRTLAGGGARRDGLGIVHVWEAASGELIWSANDHEAEVLAIAISADGTILASGGAEGEVKIRDLRTGVAFSTLKKHVGGATSIAFSADGAFLVCGAGNGATHIWETRTGALLRSCQAEGSPAITSGGDRVFNCVGLSRDGTTLATSSVSVWNMQGDPVKLWDPRTGALVRDFSAEKIQGRPMALSPDGAIVATGGKSIKLYEVRTGKRLRELFGHLKRTQSIAFSADGRLLVSGGNYGTINAWEVATGRHLLTWFTFSETHSGRGSDEWLAYSPEGDYDGSPGVDRYLSWRVGDELLTPATPGLNLHRPDRVESALKLP